MRVCVFITLICVSVLTCSANRRTENFNREWRYTEGDVTGGESSGYDDSDWQSVGLPHSFSIPYFLSKDFYEGYGWYRKHFIVGGDDIKGVLMLEFDGVFQEAEIFVNGSKAGMHRGGYTGFNVDITPYVKIGDNVVAVRVNNLWRPDLAPRGGEHVFSGGIYRNVRLVKTPCVHVDWCGVGISVTGLKESEGKSAGLVIDTDIVNACRCKGGLSLISRVVDPDGRVVDEKIQEYSLSGDSIEHVIQDLSSIDSPRLWHPAHPQIYTLETIVSYDNDVDSVVTEFGFRWIDWTSDRGFFLNGERCELRGVNAHQDQAGWGDAVTDAAQTRDVAMIKEAGFNFIRGSHYPHSPAYVRACDWAGLLYWSEVSFWGTAGPKDDGLWTASSYPIVEKDCEAFENSALTQLAEMIRIHRNHPSIIAWSMCNEPFFCAGKALPGVKRLLERMVSLSHELDPSRPAAIGGAQRPLGDERIDKIGDLAGYNGDGGTILDFHNPGIPNLVSEYGSTSSTRPGKYAPGWGDLWKDDGWRGFPWRSGQAIWCAFDHGSIFGESLGSMGIVDYFRIPKRSWYWYRNEYAGIVPPKWPVDASPARINISLSSGTPVRADGTEDVHIVVTLTDKDGNVVTASPDVELSVLSGPGEFPTGRSITFKNGSDIPVIDGQCAISMRAYYGGKSVVVARSAGLPPAMAEIEFIGAPDFDKSVHNITERPYKKFIRDIDDSRLLSFGLDSPVFASSSEPRHTPGLAADGDASTYWQPSGDDTSPSITIDTERSLKMHDIFISMIPGKYRYVVDISKDNEEWIKVTESLGNRDKTGNIQVTDLPDCQKMRFVRMTFTVNQDLDVPRVSDIKVCGTM